MKTIRIAPAALLFFLSPVIGEMLTGSTPPVAFFQPLKFCIFVGVYGGGALLVRETAHRWGKGWTSLLVLGAAFGVVNEGLAAKSFFDPNWMGLGPMVHYGRWLGINWLWGFNLTVYHTVISMAVPILLVTLAFPADRNEPWLPLSVLAGLLALVMTLTVLLFLRISPYRPPVLPYLMTVLLAVGLCRLAYRLPARPFLPVDRSVPLPFWFAVIGLIGIVLNAVVLGYMLPFTPIPAWAGGALSILCLALLTQLLLHLSGNGAAWTDRHRFALASGVLSPYILIPLLSALSKKPQPEEKKGMWLVSLAMVFFLAWVYSQIRQAAQPAMPETAAETASTSSDF